jgi:group I intron endonuclease
MQQAGIYMIFCTGNHKYYVGSTKRTFRKRWNEHKLALFQKRHVNENLQEAWDTYGSESFKLIILQVVPLEALRDIPKIEQNYLTNTMSIYPTYGMNILHFAYSLSGYKKKLP